MIDPLLMSFLRYFLKSQHFALLHGNVNSCWMYVLTALNCAGGDNLFAHKYCQSCVADGWEAHRNI